MVHAELTVAAVVCVDDRFLVIEEFAHGQRVINQPAGHVESGETLIDSVVRETFEESAWHFEPTGLVGIYHWPHEDGRTTLRFAFCGRVSQHAPNQPLDDGIIATHWLSAEELKIRDNLRSPLVLESIADFNNFDAMPLDRVKHIHGR